MSRDLLPGDEVELGLRWHDLTGTHALVLSRTGKHLYSTLFDQRDGQWSSTTLEDGNESCDDDDVSHFELGATSLTDLDGDRVFEVTFARAVGCMSDVSSADLTLTLAEGDVRHDVHGETWVGEVSENCRPPLSLVYADDPIVRLLDAEIACEECAGSVEDCSRLCTR